MATVEQPPDVTARQQGKKQMSNAQLSSAGAAHSLRTATPQSLPSFPVVGVANKESSAGAAASLANANRKSVEWWKPDQVSQSANKAAHHAIATTKSPSLPVPEASVAGSKAALLAHRDSAAQLKEKQHPSKRESLREPVAVPTHAASMKETVRPAHDAGALRAATQAARQRRPRSDSMPTQPADTALYVQNAWQTGQPTRGGGKVSTGEEDIMMSPALRAARIQNIGTNLPREMYTERPPVDVEVEHQRHEAALRASAISMAKKLYEVHPKAVEAANRDIARASAVAEMRRSGTDRSAQSPEKYHTNLHEAASKLAQERLKRIHDDEEVRAFRNYYGYGDTPMRSRVSTKGGMGRRRAASDSASSAPSMGAANEEDLAASRAIREQMSQFNSQLAAVDEQKRRQDVERLMAVARENVQTQMHEMDERVSRDVRRTKSERPKAQNEDWHLRARAWATGRSEKRMENHGKVDLGFGKFMEKEEVNQVARAKLQPEIDQISDEAQRRRQQDEEREFAKQCEKRQAELEKERQAELKADLKRARAAEKEQAKRAKQEEKERVKAEHARAKEEKALDKEREKVDKELNKEREKEERELERERAAMGAAAMAEDDRRQLSMNEESFDRSRAQEEAEAERAQREQEVAEQERERVRQEEELERERVQAAEEEDKEAEKERAMQQEALMVEQQKTADVERQRAEVEAAAERERAKAEEDAEKRQAQAEEAAEQERARIAAEEEKEHAKQAQKEEKERAKKEEKAQREFAKRESEAIASFNAMQNNAKKELAEMEKNPRKSLAKIVRDTEKTQAKEERRKSRRISNLFGSGGGNKNGGTGNGVTRKQSNFPVATSSYPDTGAPPPEIAHDVEAESLRRTSIPYHSTSTSTEPEEAAGSFPSSETPAFPTSPTSPTERTGFRSFFSKLRHLSHANPEAEVDGGSKAKGPPAAANTGGTGGFIGGARLQSPNGNKEVRPVSSGSSSLYGDSPHDPAAGGRGRSERRASPTRDVEQDESRDQLGQGQLEPPKFPSGGKSSSPARNSIFLEKFEE